MNESKFFNQVSKQEKSKRQEIAVSKFSSGKRTIASGALFRDGDIIVGDHNLRIEAKRTDKDFLKIDKKWCEKIKKQSRFDIPVLALEIKDEQWYVIRPEEFALLLEYLNIIKEK
jgi:Holliday junction resolvase